MGLYWPTTFVPYNTIILDLHDSVKFVINIFNGYAYFHKIAPQTRPQPVTSPSVSDSQACANIARATRQKHSRFARSPAHFRNSLFFAFDLKKQPFRLFFLRQLPTSPRQGACSVGMQMDINHDVTGGSFAKEQKEKTTRWWSFLFV